MFRTEGMPLSPSICAVCRASSEGPCVDTQSVFNPPVMTELNGHIYLCGECVDRAAKALDYLRPEDAEALRLTVEAVSQELVEVSEERDALLSLKEAIERVKKVKQKVAAAEDGEAV